MTARSVEMHRLQELVRLHRLKTSAREVCRLLGMGRTTEFQYRKQLGAAGLLVGDPAALPAVEVRRFDELFFDGEAKEAVAFALLGYLHLLGEPGNVPSP